jgi:hypothetical protein
MKKMTVLIAAVFAVSAPLAAFAMDHDSMPMDHGSMKMDHGSGMMEKGKPAYEKVVDGVKTTFKVMSMKEQMKGMEMPKGMKETHHLMVVFKDARSGKALTEGEVRVKVQGPDKAEQTKDLMGMEGHFGADFDLSKKGEYGVMTKFKLKDGKVRSIMFPYIVK